LKIVSVKKISILAVAIISCVVLAAIFAALVGLICMNLYCGGVNGLKIFFSTGKLLCINSNMYALSGGISFIIALFPLKALAKKMLRRFS
jgi:hypothetical protein